MVRTKLFTLKIDAETSGYEKDPELLVADLKNRILSGVEGVEFDFLNISYKEQQLDPDLQKTLDWNECPKDWNKPCLCRECRSYT